MLDLTDPLLNRTHPGVETSTQGYTNNSVAANGVLQLTSLVTTDVTHVVTCNAGMDNLLILSTFRDGCRIKGEFEDKVLLSHKWADIYGAVSARHYLCHDEALLCPQCKDAEVKPGDDYCWLCLGEKPPLGAILPMFINLVIHLADETQA